MRTVLSAAVTTAVLFYFVSVCAIVAPLQSLTLQRSDDLTIADVRIPLSPLAVTNVTSGQGIKPGTELRILCAGDSITYGFMSDQDSGDGNGYRLRLRENLSQDKVVFAGSDQSDGNMTDGWFAAWNGKTIQYISDHIDPSLKQRPTIVLIHAGTNDMNPNSAISTEGHDPREAAMRLGQLIDKVVQACPDAVVLVAMIIGTCNADQEPQTKIYQSLVPQVVAERLASGRHVLAVDFSNFETQNLRDCIHPTNFGYQLVGNYWYDFITQIPKDWISQPVGDDPVREASGCGKVGANVSLLSISLAFMVIAFLG